MFQNENKIRKKEKRSHNVVCATDTSIGDPVAQEHEVRILIRKKHPLNWRKPVAVTEQKFLKSTG